MNKVNKINFGRNRNKRDVTDQIQQMTFATNYVKLLIRLQRTVISGVALTSDQKPN